MLQDSQFKKMFIEMETLLKRKHQITEDIKEIHTRYGLSVAGYRVRKVTTLERKPELKEYLFKK